MNGTNGNPSSAAGGGVDEQLPPPPMVDVGMGLFQAAATRNTLALLEMAGGPSLMRHSGVWTARSGAGTGWIEGKGKTPMAALRAWVSAHESEDGTASA